MTSGFVSVDDLMESKNDDIDTFGDNARRWSVARGILIEIMLASRSL